jgi:hypothetical protein
MKQRWCIDCDQMASKFCIKCGVPLCKNHYKIIGKCEDCRLQDLPTDDDDDENGDKEDG